MDDLFLVEELVGGRGGGGGVAPLIGPPCMLPYEHVCALCKKQGRMEYKQFERMGMQNKKLWSGAMTIWSKETHNHKD